MKREDYISFGKVPDVVYELTGVTRTRQTVYWWAVKGRRLSDGQRIKLKHTKRAGIVYTTRQWVEDFLREVG